MLGNHKLLFKPTYFVNLMASNLKNNQYWSWIGFSYIVTFPSRILFIAWPLVCNINISNKFLFFYCFLCTDFFSKIKAKWCKCAFLGQAFSTFIENRNFQLWLLIFWHFEEVRFSKKEEKILIFILPFIFNESIFNIRLFL